MVAKSILQIDVNDDAFSVFQEKFLKYQAEVAKQPSAWRRIGASVKSTDNELLKLGKTVGETVKGIQLAANRQQMFQVAAAGSARSFISLARSSKQIAGNLKDGAAFLLKWTGAIGLISGVIGGGGLFGISRMAASASQNRRESQGLGVSGGELQAAQINYQKLVNVDEMLARINEARTDVTKRWAFSAAGMNPSEMEGKSNSEILTKLVPLLKSTFEKSGGTMQGAQAHGLLEFADMSTLTRLKAIGKDELAITEQNYRKSLKQLEISDNVNRAWQSLEMKFNESGTVIEKMFKEKLVSLSGPLEHLSEAFTKAVKAFLDSPKIEKWITSAATGLENLSKYLESDKFSKSMNEFLDGVDDFAGNLMSIGRTLNKVFNVFDEKSLKASEYRKLDELRKVNPALADNIKYRLENPIASQEKGDKFNAKSGWALKRNRDIWNEDMQAALKGPQGTQIKALLDSLGISSATQQAAGKIVPATGKSPAMALPDYAELERKRNLPRGLLSAVEWQESRGNPNAIGPMTKYGRAKGAFQWMDHTRGEYGVTDPFNKQQAAAGAAWKLEDLLKRYKGDTSKALAAYNWGEGNLDKNGMENAPRETREYVRSIMERLEKSVGESRAPQAPSRTSGGGAVIRIENNTGGNAVVIGSQLAQ